MREDEADIEAEVTYLSTEEGGRTSPGLTGYRPEFKVDGTYWVSVHDYPDVGSVRPGETARALISFVSPHELVGRLSVGMEFEVTEGGRLVARGRVTRIVNLQNSARAAALRSFVAGKVADEAFAFWESRRLPWNVCLALVGVIAAMGYLAVADARKLDDAPFGVLSQGCGYFFAMVLANVLYCLGPRSERWVRPERRAKYRAWAFNTFFWASLALPMLVPALLWLE